MEFFDFIWAGGKLDEATIMTRSRESGVGEGEEGSGGGGERSWGGGIKDREGMKQLR